MTGGRGPSWLTATLLAAAGFLAGVVLVVAIRGIEHDRVRTVTETRAGPTVTVPATSGDAVPDVVGAALDDARDRLERAGFEVKIASGGGLFGPVVDSDWEVVDQRPAAGTDAEPGSAVGLDIERR